MSILRVFVGLDYHDDFVRVCVLDADGTVLVNRNCANDVEAVGECIFGKGIPDSIAIEACGGAADFASKLSQMYGWEVRLAHPGYVNKLKQSPDKSDCTDAELLADLVRVNYLPEVWLAPEETRQLRRLARFRQSLAAERKRIKQQIRSLLIEERLKCERANPWTKDWMDWVRHEAALGEQARWVMNEQLNRLEAIHRQMERVETRCAEVTQDDRLMQSLLAQPGIGLVTAFVMRAEIGTIDRFKSGKQLSRFCSVTPLNASSGKRQADAGMVKQANPELRRVVVEAAQRLGRYDPRFQKFKRQLVERGKPASVAIVAVANRWIRGLYHQLKQVRQDNQMFQAVT